MNIKKYLPLFIIALLTGCELVVDVDIPIEKNQLVLNSFFTPDSIWKARVTLSRHILDQANYQYVKNAEVIVYHGDLPIDTLRHDSIGYYQSNNGGPQHSKKYSIRVTAPGYSAVESTSACPSPIAAEFSDPQVTVGEFQEIVHTFNITFTDPPGNHFYQVMAIAEYRYTNPHTGQGFINRYNPHVYSDDPGIDPEEIANNEGFFFPDVLFEGQKFTVNVKMSASHWRSDSDPVKYRIYFRSVSEDYYKYKVTYALQEYTSGDPFAQPVKVYNNIESGLGIFAGYSGMVFEYEK